MCGIHFTLSASSPVRPDGAVEELLQNRGPDSFQQLEITVNAKDCNILSGKAQQYHMVFSSSVLSLRGDHTAIQPFQDRTTGSILCWNGEAWKIGETRVSRNDGEILFSLLNAKELSKARQLRSLDDVRLRIKHIAAVFDSVRGPYAFVYFDALIDKVFFGRDCLGRRSLLNRTDSAGVLTISSVCARTHEHGCDEVKANGIYVLDLWKTTTDDRVPALWHIPYSSESLLDPGAVYLVRPIPVFNRDQSTPIIPPLELHSPSTVALEQQLSDSVRLRVESIPLPPTPGINLSEMKCPKIAILFSGGLDCTLLARLAHDLLPLDEAIDLLNVAFENPRVLSAAKHQSSTGPYENQNLDPYSQCPDRITGKASHAELQQVCPGRTWRFVSINIPYAETLQHRNQVISLMHPHNTEMDLSISYALYFAARGRGTVYNATTNTTQPYTTPARVLLSGLGADELFAGYTRHATAFSRHGFPGLLDELELDINRLGQRNLGRDDRVTSHWGKEARYPYLDESFLSWALACPVWEKCGFGQESVDTGLDSGAKPRLEPGKKALRLLAWKMAMRGVAREKKRAIQFGARTAKMQGGKVKGTQVLSPS